VERVTDARGTCAGGGAYRQRFEGGRVSKWSSVRSADTKEKYQAASRMSSYALGSHHGLLAHLVLVHLTPAGR
jgi:hypothetical protein